MKIKKCLFWIVMMLAVFGCKSSDSVASQSFDVDGLVYTIEGIGIDEYDKEKAILFLPDEGNEYIFLKIKCENTTDEEGYPEWRTFLSYSLDGSSHSWVVQTPTGMKHVNHSDVKPDSSQSENVYFEVPIDQPFYVVKFKEIINGVEQDPEGGWLVERNGESVTATSVPVEELNEVIKN